MIYIELSFSYINKFSIDLLNKNDILNIELFFIKIIKYYLLIY